jgi:hypothetical protein|tara:strand:- start:163 stop:402 length:240 start_codon:yes stop_codon:yes gene_type:complete
MKVGDLVQRKILTDAQWPQYEKDSATQRERLGPGIIISKQMGGSNPVHPCLTIFFLKGSKTWDIAESLMEPIGLPWERS